EQGEEKQDSTYSIGSTDKVDLEEFDLKALIADEDAMDKEVKDKVKNHKRKHGSDDDEDDDDDEGPSAGSNQGMSTKKRRHDSGASGSAQPHTKDDEQSSKNPRESDASASKQHPALTSTGWQITNTRDDVVNLRCRPLRGLSQFLKARDQPTPEPEWTIPPNDFPEPENNWANTYATTYKV
ncbi:hypothetical protein Tco_0187108, partial [Tanacetum coccineum]